MTDPDDPQPEDYDGRQVSTEENRMETLRQMDAESITKQLVASWAKGHDENCESHRWNRWTCACAQRAKEFKA
jgi:hypothetical protein